MFEHANVIKCCNVVSLTMIRLQWLSFPAVCLPRRTEQIAKGHTLVLLTVYVIRRRNSGSS